MVAYCDKDISIVLVGLVPALLLLMGLLMFPGRRWRWGQRQAGRP